MKTKTTMVQKNAMFQQRGEVIGWELPLVHMAFEFHTGVLELKFFIRYGMVGSDGSWTL